MKMFVTELLQKTIMSTDGEILGQIDNFVVDTKNGDIPHVLVIPTEDVEPKRFKTDSRGRLVLPFDKVRSAKDVVVIGPL